MKKTLEMPNNAAALDKLRMGIKELVKVIDQDKEKEYFATYLMELQKYEHPENKFIGKILDGKTPEARTDKMLKKTDFTDLEKLEKILAKDPAKFKKFEDPILDAARIIVPKYNEAVTAFQSSTPRRKSIGS
jgi:soluble cytochrome b562